MPGPWLLLAAVNVAALTILFSLGLWLFTQDGSVRGHDYLAHWAAGRRVLSGQAVLAYDWAGHSAYQARLTGQSEVKELPILNPPHFLFTTPVFAWLTYLQASIAFLLFTICAYAASLRLILRSWVQSIVVAISGGGAFYSLWWVQNGFLTSSLLTAGVVLLRSSPILAGICFGVLTIKPQLGLLIPVALIASRNWRAIAAAAATFLVLAVAAEVLLGAGIWARFLQSLLETGAFLQAGNLWFKQQSAFALFLPLAGIKGAWAVQILLALTLAAATYGMWKGATDFWVRASALIAGSLLVTPYLYPYDGVCLTASACMLLYKQKVRPLARWEAALVYLGCITPLFTRIAFSAAMPIGALALFYVALRLQDGQREASRATAEPVPA